MSVSIRITITLAIIPTTASSPLDVFTMVGVISPTGIDICDTVCDTGSVSVMHGVVAGSTKY